MVKSDMGGNGIPQDVLAAELIRAYIKRECKGNPPPCFHRLCDSAATLIPKTLAVSFNASENLGQWTDFEWGMVTESFRRYGGC